MSTNLTTRKTPMVESLSLKLAFASRRLNQALLNRVAGRLTEIGYEAATPAALDFLGALECGENHASEIARMMGLSRQRVAKNVSQFCDLGYLEQLPGRGRSKRILFTPRGEALMADARKELAALDIVLKKRIGALALSHLVDIAETVAETVAPTSISVK